jgi:hypothetical protein
LLGNILLNAAVCQNPAAANLKCLFPRTSLPNSRYSHLRGPKNFESFTGESFTKTSGGGMIRQIYKRFKFDDKMRPTNCAFKNPSSEISKHAT